MSFALFHLTNLTIQLLLIQSLNAAWRSGRFSLAVHGTYAAGTYGGFACLHLLPRSPAVASGVDVFGFAALLAGGIAAGIAFSLFQATFMRHLRGDYFAVASLITAQILISAFANTDAVGAGQGIEIGTLVRFAGGSERLGAALVYALLGLVLNVVLFACLYRLFEGPQRVRMEAVRQNEPLALACGISVDSCRRVALIAGGAGAGSAGALMLAFVGFAAPSDFDINLLLPAIVSVVLGRSRLLSVLLAGSILYALNLFLQLRGLNLLGAGISDFVAAKRDALVAILLLIFLLLPGWWRQFRRNTA